MTIFMLIIATLIIMAIIVILAMRNPPLECTRCKYLIESSLKGQCPVCNFDNYEFQKECDNKR